ncbi:MAG: NAD-dependent epimerase/dehydratase family protein [Actinobacteria bacterium]|nr:NAD-dependent epimerase/dehydratase family protein [Actinomycetota bacterium]
MGRILVTGAAGFIGSHLVDRLLELGHEVTGLDCFTDYYSRDLKQRNLDRALSHGRFRFFEGDLLRSNLDEIVGGVDKVAHLAGEPGVRASWGERFPVYLERNVQATQRLLEATSRVRPKQFVLASSSSVYGADNGGPAAEDDPRRPASPYGLSKLAAEELVGLYEREHAVPATVLRYFTVYGPRQRPEMALSRFISLAGRGELVEVFGDGTQSREMTYISDVVDATVAALEAKPEGAARVYNVGGGTRTTVVELVELVGEMMGERVEIRHAPPAHGDVRSTWADLERAARELGYRPRVSLEEGVEEQVRWALAECARRRTPSIV